MIRIHPALAMLCCAMLSSAPATAGPLDELLQRVKQERSIEQQQNRQREQDFLQQRNQQQRLLQEARARLQQEEQRSEALKQSYADQQTQIAEEKRVLQQNLGELGQLHGIVRSFAGDLRGILDASMISAQLPDRTELAANIAESSELPSIEQLEHLWHLQLQEMVESGRIVRFPAQVISGDGAEQQQQVTRVGAFTATSGGYFLRYLADGNHLVEPARQPAPHFQRMASGLEAASNGPVSMAIDPTRGAMLALLVRSPDLRERLLQGGIVGYLIIGLGVVGLLIALERFFSLGLTARRVRSQLTREEASDKNPLGRILQVYADSTSTDTETLGLRLDEAILKELPRVQRGLGTLSVLAAIAPLLGLLGTVTGIIETFQAISLYGTGDPRIMSGGISQALVTTVLGLVVAIPLLLIHSLLASRSGQIVQILDEQSAALVARRAEQRLGL